MKVRAEAVLQHAGLTVFAGEVIELPEADAANLISAGIASAVEVPVPADAPKAFSDDEKKPVE